MEVLPQHFQEHFQRLNAMQRKAVSQTEGPVLVLAGAGTGKTRVLTTRLAFILLSHKAHFGQVLAVTFTNKAAAEIQARMGSFFDHSLSGVWLGTFHKIGVRFLRQHAQYGSLQENFTILDTEDQLRLIKQIMQLHQWDEKRYLPRVLLGQIRQWKDRALYPERVSLAQDSQPGLRFARRLYEVYQTRLVELNAVDFGDLIMIPLEILTHHLDLLAIYREKFRYIFVDEYQDINVAQYLLLRLLAQGHQNICCVGDDDQSIYGWRGAEVENILRFEKDFPGACVVYLEENYRSTSHILSAASGLIAHNQNRWKKELKTAKSEGEKVVIKGVYDGKGEARWVAETILGLSKKGCSLSSMAILLRAGFQTREFEERFIQLGLPYRVIGGMRFYERLEIRDILAYLRLIVQLDDSLAFERVLSTPKRGIGPSTLKDLHQKAHEEHCSLFKAAELILEQGCKPRISEKLGHLLSQVYAWRSDLDQLEPHVLADKVIEESGYREMWKKDQNIGALSRLENLKELVKALQEFETLPQFLEHVSLVMDTASASDSNLISLMTLHAAKGLEFDTVFLTGWEEDLFPHPRCLLEKGTQGLEEERRLAYVGLTRAKSRAFISFAWNRFVYQGWRSCVPSRFIDELPALHIDRLCDTPSPAHLSSQRSPVYSGKPLGQPSVELRVGDHVSHVHFGKGKIVDMIGDHLDIFFETSGRKKIKISFVNRIR